MRASRVVAIFMSPIGQAEVTFFMLGTVSVREALEIATPMGQRIFDGRFSTLVSLGVSHHHEVENQNCTMHFPSGNARG